DDLPPRLRHGKTPLRRSRRSQRCIKLRLLRSLHAVKIHSPCDARIKSCYQALHSYRQFSTPDFLRLVQNHPPLQSALQIMLLARRDVEVDPEAVGADFEFFVSAKIRAVGFQECFSNVTVPKLGPSSIRLGSWENR